MWLRKEDTGKREIAFMTLIAAFALTIWFGSSMDSKELGNLIEWWVFIAAMLVAGAFGFEALKRLIESQAGAPKSQNVSVDYPSDIVPPEQSYATEGQVSSDWDAPLKS